jgi:hypothetical protein
MVEHRVSCTGSRGRTLLLRQRDILTQPGGRWAIQRAHARVMLRIPDGLRPPSPGDVLHGSTTWREISRDEAINAAESGRVVIVYQNLGRQYADWFVPDRTFFLGVGPHALHAIRYYRRRDPLLTRTAVTPSASGPERSAVLTAAPAPASQPASLIDRPVRDRKVVEQKTWIEIELLDEFGTPVLSEPYTLRLPDGSTRRGTLDRLGRARVDGIEPGMCEVSFPRIDGREWRKA